MGLLGYKAQHHPSFGILCFITNKGVLLTYERKDLRPGSTDGDWKKARER